MDDIVEDLDSTQALLDHTFKDSVLQDSSEDEIFFGKVYSKEKKRKPNRRDTMVEDDLTSFSLSQRDRSNMSLLSSDMSIPEEDFDDDGKIVLQDAEITSSGCQDLGEEEEEVFSAAQEEGEMFAAAQEVKEVFVEAEDEKMLNDNLQDLGLNVTERRQSKPVGRAAVVSLPSWNSEDSHNWETESEESYCEPSDTDATEMEVSVEISGIKALAGTSQSGLYDSFSEDTQEEIVEEGQEDCRDEDENIVIENREEWEEEEEEESRAMERKDEEESRVVEEQNEVNEIEEYMKDLQYYAAVADRTEDSVEDEEEEDCVEEEEEDEEVFVEARRTTVDMDESERAQNDEDDGTLEEEQFLRDANISSGSDRISALNPECASVQLQNRSNQPSIGDDSVFSRRSLEALSASTVSFMEQDPEEVGMSQEDEESELGLSQVIITRPSLAMSTYHTAPSSLRQSMVDEPRFDTTMDEMMLYEIYGESYDDVVDAMSIEEKINLQEKLARKKAADDAVDVKERLNKLLASQGRRSQVGSIGSTISPFSLGTASPSLSPREEAGRLSPPSWKEGKEGEIYRVEIPEQSPPSSPLSYVSETSDPLQFKQPTTPDALYTLPTVASINRRASPSPKKTPCSSQPMWYHPSPIPGRELSTSPLKPVPRANPASRIPQPGFLLSSATKPLPQLRTPVQGLRLAARFTPAQVYSPVADYVRSNPAPPLVRNVAAKETNRDLESTLMEVENKENFSPSFIPPCPLPANTYTAAGINEEIQIDVTAGREYNYIPEAYGQQVNTDARVTKHLARRRVDKVQLQEQHADLSGAASGSGLQYQRTSSMESSTLDMSVLETKVVRKFATPLQHRLPNNFN